MTENNDKLIEEISKIRKILEDKHTRAEIKINWKEADAFMWQSDRGCFKPVKNVNSIPLELLKGIDQNIDILLENTIKFSKSFKYGFLSNSPTKVGIPKLKASQAERAGPPPV